MENTLPGLVERNLWERPDAIAFQVETSGGFEARTYRQFAIAVRNLAAALEARGFGRGDRVCIVAPNTIGWEIADKAVQWLGGVTVGLDPNTSPQAWARQAETLGATGIFLETQQQLELAPLPKNTRLVASFQHVDSLPTLAELIAEGRRLPTPAIACHPDDIASLVLTSGTTGEPKAIPMTHRQLLDGARVYQKAFACEIEFGHRTASWMPLYNASGRMLSVVNSLIGVEQWLISNPRHLIDHIQEIQPTYLVALPRLMEKAHEAITGLLSAKPAVATAVKTAINMRKRGLAPADWMLQSLRSRIFGPDIRFLISGSAPSDPSILQFFDDIGIPTYELYGMSEVASPVAMNRPGDVHFGSVGTPVTEVRIAADGEILVRSSTMAANYDGEEESLLVNGYYPTGDLGSLDAAGRLHIQGRKKDVFKTSTGRKITPAPIEQVYKRAAGVEDVLVIGHGRKFVSALVVLDGATQQRLQEEGRNAHQVVAAEFVRLQECLESGQRIATFTIVEPFEEDQGEVTPSLKLRRHVIEQTRLSTIEAMYRTAGQDGLSPMQEQSCLPR